MTKKKKKQKAYKPGDLRSMTTMTFEGFNDLRFVVVGVFFKRKLFKTWEIINDVRSKQTRNSVSYENQKFVR